MEIQELRDLTLKRLRSSRKIAGEALLIEAPHILEHLQQILDLAISNPRLRPALNLSITNLRTDIFNLELGDVVEELKLGSTHDNR